MKMKWRLMVSTSVILALVMLGQALYDGWADHGRTRTALLQKAEVLADDQAALLAEPVWNFEFDAMERVLKPLERLPEFRGAILRYPDGKVLIRVGGALDGQDIVRFSRQITHPGADRPLGELTLAFSTADLHASLGQSVRRSLGITVLILIVVNLALALAFSRILRPMERVEQATRHLAEGDLDQDIPETERDDEVGELARAIARLREGVRALHDLQASLSDRIARQTRDLRLARDKAEEAVRARDLFLATVSHELRTPLTSIRAAVALVLTPDAAQLSPKGRELMEIARRNCDRLSELVNDILDSQALAAHQLTIERELLDLCALVDRVIVNMDSLAMQNGVMLHRGDMAAPAWVRGDRHRLEQVVRHLLQNAIKFSPRGRFVLVELIREGQWWRLVIADQGPGIPEDVRGNVFEQFARSDTGLNRNQGGAGLGLSLVRELVALHGGTVTFETCTASDLSDVPAEQEQVTGTSFHVLLPCAEAASPGLQQDQPLAS